MDKRNQHWIHMKGYRNEISAKTNQQKDLPKHFWNY